jgi:hypothetical protein
VAAVISGRGTVRRRGRVVAALVAIVARYAAARMCCLRQVGVKRVVAEMVGGGGNGPLIGRLGAAPDGVELREELALILLLVDALRQHRDLA